MTATTGWDGLDAPPPAVSDAERRQTLARVLARLFGGADGELALDYLRQLTVRRALGPDASDAALRMLEGQRQLVLHLESFIRVGRDGG